MDNRRALQLVLLASAIFAASGQVAVRQPESAGPPMPYEDIGACPFEGCVYRDWIANSPVTVRTERRADSPIAFTLEKGEHIRAITGIVVILKPGRVQFQSAADLTSTAGRIHVEPGETLYLLTYHGEGSTTAWFKGRLYDEVDGSEFINAQCDFQPGSCNGTIVEKLQKVWWVRLMKQNRLTGWTNEAEKFDNKDLFG
jgi:hypothetical protein